MTLIVTDADGKKYRPTGEFREPAVGEYVYCFNCKRVERRLPEGEDFTATRITEMGMSLWCSFAHVEFNLHRIIVEPLPVEYEVTVRLTEAEYDKACGETRSCESANAIRAAIRAGNYREVS